MLTKQFEGYTIKIFDDKYFNPNSADNVHRYDVVYGSSKDLEYRATSTHGIKIFDETGELIKTVCVRNIGGATGIHQNSIVIFENKLLICCSDSIFCIELPSLNILWNKVCDMATCFGIYHYKNDFIIHGEMAVSRINIKGELVWEYTDRDIFTSLNSEDDFRIINNMIFVKVYFNGERVINAENGKIMTLDKKV